MKKKIIRILLTVGLPPTVYFGFVYAGKLVKTVMGDGPGVPPDFLAGIIGIIGLGLMCAAVVGSYLFAGWVMDGVGEKLADRRREREIHQRWQARQATEEDEDELYRQRIGVEG